MARGTMQLTFSPKPLSHPGKHCSTYYETKQYNYVTGDCLLILLSCFFPLLSSSQNIGLIALLLFKNSLTVHGNIFAYTCWPDTFYRFFILVCFAPHLFCIVVFSSLPYIMEIAPQWTIGKQMACSGHCAVVIIMIFMIIIIIRSVDTVQW